MLMSRIASAADITRNLPFAIASHNYTRPFASRVYRRKIHFLRARFRFILAARRHAIQMKNRKTLPKWSGDAVIKGPYRYLLQRFWNVRRPCLGLIMLNPSTADAKKNDATIDRMMTRAVTWGYGQLEVANLFALRATEPEELYDHPDPIGPDNDGWILNMARVCSIIICGWGNHGTYRNRDKHILALLRGLRAKTYALRVTRDGNPAHPLYLPYRNRPVRFPP